MDTNPSPRDGPPVPEPGADASSPPVSQSFQEVQAPSPTAVTGPPVLLHKASSGSTEAQPASSDSDLPHAPMDSSEENLLKLKVHLKQEDLGVGSAPIQVKNEDNDPKQFPGMCKAAQDESADGLEDAQMPDVMEIDNDSSSDDEDNEADSDFHSRSESDSDCSQEAGRRAKRRRSKPATTTSPRASVNLQELETLRNKLIVKKMTEGLTGDEPETLEKLEKQVSEAQRQPKAGEKAPKRNKNKKKRAKTAREYWQRELGNEPEGAAKKRKNEGEVEGPNKAQKNTTGSHPKQSIKNSTAATRADMLRSLGDINKRIIDGTVPTMGVIQAHTHQDQIKQMVESIPKGCDTRRTKTQRKDLEQAKSSFGYKKVEAVDGTWKLKDMETGLLNYQIVAAAWMTKREAQDLHPAGGLLADDMGLGKTITTLACIIGHPPEKEDRDEFSRATLVVVNNQQTANQWSEQIEKHCPEAFFSKTCIYSKNIPWKAAQWGRRNIVITTYAELVAQFPKKKAVQALKAMWASDRVGFENALQRGLGKLFKVNWYRVVLDEAHAIKNRTSGITFACWQLSAKYRWVVSGTPISNSIEEFYPYLKFLGCSFAVNLGRFKSEYMDGRQSNDNFAALVSMVMYRRKQDEAFMGYKIVPLPKIHSQDLWVPLEDWEKALIQAVDNRYESEMPDEEANDQEQGDEGEPPAEEANDQEQDDEAKHEDTDQDLEPAHEEDNDAAKAEEDATDKEDDDAADAEEDVALKHQTAFSIRNTRCVRLRQGISHPLNLEKFLREKSREEDIQQAIEQLKEEAEKIQNDSDEAQTHAEQLAQDKAVRDKFSVGAHQIETLYKDLFGGAEEMAKLRALATNEHEVQEVTCGLCKKANPPVSPTRGANCEHIFCERCLFVGIPKGMRLVKVEFICPVPGCSAKLAVGEDVTTPECIKTAMNSAKESKDFQEPGRDSIGTNWTGDAEGYNSFFHATCGREDIHFGPVKMPWGSKVKATVEVILTWLKEAPEDKMIVFVEFTRTSKALGCILETLGIDFLYYNGTVTNKRKDLALKEFRENPERKILLASMKCGGQALDLPVANRVIIVDIWWNKTVEQQAFKRVHRIGQKKETHLVRIMARGSIDERLYMLQNAKEAIVNRALQDDGHVPNFTETQALQWLFSDKSEDDLIQDIDAKARAKNGKGKGKKKA
ncbi:hypothetical protein NCS55_01000300 [Fusarium keratoplasticum]|nr:hypothetical protein NCS55_01000300 [Fusarium keratoplasticum]